MIHYKSMLLILYVLFGFGFYCSDNNQPDAVFAQPDSSEAVVASETSHQAFVQDEISCSRHNAITRAIENVSPAVVGINVVQIKQYRTSPFYNDPFWQYFFPPQQYRQKVQGLGSGFIIAPNGYVLTNAHVIRDAVEIIVTTTDGEQHPAKLIGASDKYDVALLQIEGTGFPYIPMGNSDDLIIGEWAIALGNPFGLFDVSAKPTVTVGVISATDMDFKGALQIEDRLYDKMIQTDASINGGNSGGPLVNSLGKCIGINTFIISGQSGKGSVGIGFAIPINRVKEILPALKNIREIQKNFETGMEVENMSWLMARTLGISPRDGVIVTDVKKNSPASKAGIEVGDVILIIDDRRIRSTADIQALNEGIDVIGTRSLPVQYFRDGKIYKTEIAFKE